jgi:two-component system sensor histidine kinase MprB
VSVRGRLVAVVVAAAGAVLLVLAGAVTVASGALLDGVDAQLALAADLVGVPPDPTRAPGGVSVQLVDPGGRIVAGTAAGSGGEELVRDADLRLAPGESSVRTQEVGGAALRVLTRGAGQGVVQVATPVDALLAARAELRRRLAAVAAVAVLAALLAGRFTAQRVVVAPLRRVSAQAEAIARSDDPAGRVDPLGGDDELDRLVRGYNRLLGRLRTSREAQRRLLADASHELRTPLAAVRANVELLTGPDRLAPDDVEEVRRLLAGELEELERLVDDLIDLGRAGARPLQRRPVRLDLLARAVTERARARHPTVAFSLDLSPRTVSGDADRLEHALANLLGNAVKHGLGTPVEVTVDAAGLAVRDHGPGIAPEDLVRVFDRFWRAEQARGRPGSGLGLAIVRQIAREHDGRVVVDLPPGGGARFQLRLPEA